MSVTGTTIGKPWKPRPKRAGAAAGVNPLHGVTVAGVPQAPARYPGMIVYVRQSARHVRSFRRFCEFQRIAVVIRVDRGDGRWGRQAVVCVPGICWDEMESACGPDGAWEVLGSTVQLDALSRHPLVLRWHPVLSIGVMSCAGSGPEKVVSKKQHKDPKAGVWTELHNEYREQLRLGKLSEAADILIRLGENAKK